MNCASMQIEMDNLFSVYWGINQSYYSSVCLRQYGTDSSSLTKANKIVYGNGTTGSE